MNGGAFGETRWQDVDDLFRRLLEVPAPERGRYLAAHTPDDPALRAAVEELLESVDEAGDFLEVPLDVAGRVDLDGLYQAVRGETDAGAETNGHGPDGDAGRVGELVGPFRLASRLGRGGMATVYVADRVEGGWEQTVALKLLRRGIDTDDVVRRFRAERQILSSLDHPHIARLLDGGTTDVGLPYLAMELVDGEPITDFCDNRSLGLRERLTLFRKVGRAVQYAHRNLVVHRDLKPSNILVGRGGEPKLLDFGIAKVLAEDPYGSSRTRTGRRLLTPDYASPEQLAGGRINVSSDVYQLGVLLCVLLTGRLPWVRRSDESGTEGSTVSKDAIRPSRLVTSAAAEARGLSKGRLVRQLRGDLGLIVLKALRERPEDRYASAEAMIDDLERYVDDRPIAARADVWTYRVTKLVRRKPWLLPVVAASLIVVIGYGLTLRRHAAQVEAERNVARAEAERAQETQDFLVELFGSSDPYARGAATGPDITVVEALDLGVERIDQELADRPVLRASLLGAVGDVYMNIGRGEASIPLHAEAVELIRGAVGPEDPSLVMRMRRLGRSLLESNRTDSARVVLEAGLQLARKRFGAQDTTVVQMLNQLARVENAEGRYEEAVARFRESVAIGTALDPPPLVELSGAHYGLALTYPHLNHPDAALASGREALRLSREALGEHHASTAIKYVGLAQAFSASGQYDEATSHYRRGIEGLVESFGRDHPDVLTARSNLALVRGRAGDLPGAEAELRTLLDADMRRYGPLSGETGSALQNLASIVGRQGRMDEALDLVDRAERAFLAAHPKGHYLTAFPLLTRAEMRLRQESWSQAEAAARAAVEVLGAGLPAGHYATAVGRCRVGRALVGRGRTGEGRRWLVESAEAIVAASVAPASYRVECLSALIDVLDREADADLVERYLPRLEAAQSASEGGP